MLGPKTYNKSCERTRGTREWKHGEQYWIMEWSEVFSEDHLYFCVIIFYSFCQYWLTLVKCWLMSSAPAPDIPPLYTNQYPKLKLGCRSEFDLVCDKSRSLGYSTPTCQHLGASLSPPPPQSSPPPNTMSWTFDVPRSPFGILMGYFCLVDRRSRVAPLTSSLFLPGTVNN